MGRLLKKLAITVVVVLIAILVALYTIIPGYLQKTIESQGTKALKATVSVENVELASPYPITFVFKNLSMRSPERSGKILSTKVEMSLKSIWPFYPKIVISVVNPELKIEVIEPEKKSETKKADTEPLVADPKKLLPGILADLNAEFVVKNLNASYKTPQDTKKIQMANFQIKMESITKPIELLLDAGGTIAGLSIPVKFNGKLEFKEDSLNIGAGELEVLSIKSLVNGYYKPATQGMDFVIKSNIPDLKALPLPKDAVVKSWTGEVTVNGRAYRKDASQAPFLSATYAIKSLKAQIAVSEKDYELSGAAQLSSTGEIKYFNELAVKDLTWDFDLTESKVSYKNIFDKPVGAALKSHGNLNLSQKVEFKSATANLDHLKITADGTYDPNGSSDISFGVGPAKLNGLEKYFPPIKKYPLEGEVDVSGKVSGVLTDANKIIVDIKSLVAKKVKGTIEYQSEGVLLKGPVSLNLQSKLQMTGTDLVAGEANTFADISDLEIKYKDLFVKNPGQMLRFELEGQKAGKEFLIRKGNLQTFFGKLELRGRPPLHANDKLRISAVIPGIEMQKLGSLLPTYKQWLVPGSLGGKIDVEGQLVSTDFWSSKLTTRGSIDLNLKEFVFKKEAKPSSADNNEASPESSNEIEPIKPILPDSPLISGLNLSLHTQIGHFAMERLAARDVQINASIANKEFKVLSGTVGQIFGGQLKLKKMRVPVTIDNPKVDLETSFSNLEASMALGWIKPEWSALAKGQVSGEVSGSSPLPTAAKFIERINAMGRFQVKNGVLNTVNFESMAKEALGKIPGAGNMNLSRGPLQADMEGDFTFDDATLILNSFHAITPRKEEANLSGKLGLNMNMDMSGDVTLVDVPKGGDFWEANKDSQGRIVVPVKISGNAMKPNLSFAESTINTMLKKVGEYELNKGKDKLLKGLFK